MWPVHGELWPTCAPRVGVVECDLMTSASGERMARSESHALDKHKHVLSADTVIALMLPYVVVIFILWPPLVALWHIFGLPWGV